MCVRLSVSKKTDIAHCMYSFVCIQQVDLISMYEDTTHSPHDLLWDDEVEDDTVDNMVRLIQESKEFNKSMFVGGLTGVDLARIRADKKQKEKEAKEKKEDKEKRDRENQPESPEMDASEVGDHNHIANLVASLVKPNIENSVASEAGKLEVKLVKAIQDELQKLQGAVVKSITDLLAKAISNTTPHEDIMGGESADNTHGAAPTGPRGTDNANPSMTTHDVQASTPAPANVNNGCLDAVDSLLKSVVADIDSLSNPNEVRLI